MIFAPFFAPVWSRRQTAWGLGGLVALAIILYARAPAHGFLNWDDSPYVTDNPLIRNFDFATVRAAFSHFYQAFYLPLVWVSFMLDYQLWPRLLGILPLDPFGFHLQNVLWFAATLPVIFFLTRGFVNHALVAWLTTALFVVHPVHVEAVAWVTARKDVLFGFFFFATLLAYLRFQKEGGKGWYALSLFLFAASCFSKLTAIVLPVILIFIDWQNQKSAPSRSLCLNKIPFFLLTFALALASAQVTGEWVREDFSWATRLTLTGEGLLFYLGKAFFPFSFSLHYPLPQSLSSLPWDEIAMSMVGVGILGWILIRKGQGRFAVFCAVFFLIPLAPVLKLFPTGTHLAADRYLYLSTFSACLITAMAIVSTQRKLLLIPLFLLIGGWAVLTWQRISIWRDPLLLWENVVDQYPDYDTGHFLLARTYRQRGQVELEQGEWRKGMNLIPAESRERLLEIRRLLDHHHPKEAALALRAAPKNDEVFGVEVYFDIAAEAEKQGQEALATELYNTLLERKREPLPTHSALAQLALRRQQPEAAIPHLQWILQRFPNHANTWADLGLAYLQQGQTEPSRTAFTRSLHYQPSHPMAILRLSEFLVSQGRQAEAESHLSDALAEDPQNALVQYALGTLLLQRGAIPEAIKHLRLSRALAPQFPGATINLAGACFLQGDFTRAEMLFLRAIRSDPLNPSLWDSLGDVYEARKKTEDAVAAHRKAYQLNPKTSKLKFSD